MTSATYVETYDVGAPTWQPQPPPPPPPPPPRTGSGCGGGGGTRIGSLESSIASQLALSVKTSGPEAKPVGSGVSVTLQPAPVDALVTRTCSPAGGSSTTCVRGSASTSYVETALPSVLDTT